MSGLTGVLSGGGITGTFFNGFYKDLLWKSHVIRPCITAILLRYFVKKVRLATSFISDINDFFSHPCCFGKYECLSHGGDAQFIKVSIKRIERPATQFEKETLIEDAVSRSLIATPDKFALASGSQRIIRLIPLQHPEKETAWRVYFEAVGAPEELKDKTVQENSHEQTI